ncbi:L-fucose mutarotase [Halalkalibacter okhensis]|uniref:Fucose isomerase n=1 Tax=Halalkalibacter okhensis TaxID=333138 RepID=A0A0B0IPQ5_9BACI|nr:L-fucose mutarotase [Halalkalibacter okhensis]KHF41661.1 fucose isomerase [Halalkalibacter okhensis]
MLKGIPSILSPELLKVLAEMGHSDEIVLADGNFPAASHSQKLIRCDGHDIPDILEAVLELFPLDSYVEQPGALMKVESGDNVTPTIWEDYKKITKVDLEMMDRFDFYERAKKAYAIVATGERALYANIILKKGVVSE